MIKNYIKLFFISFCITCFLSFTNAQCKLDSIYRYELEELKSKSIFYDDTINDQKIEIQWSWNPVFLMWKPSYKYISTVDSDENVLSRVKQNFITSFSNYSKDNWTYDSNGNMTSHVYQVWDTTLGDFINSVKRVYVYNVNNNRVLFLYQNWNFASETWENNYHIETGYNNLNKISELFQNWDNQNQVWENYNRSLNFVNDVNNNVLSFDVQSWNNIDSVWRTDAMYQVNYTYDNSNNVISEYKKYWDNVNQIWTNVDGRFETFYYDESNNQTYYRQEFWDTISSSWDTISIIHYTNAYDLYNNLISVYRQDTVNGYPGYNSLKVYYYDCNFANIDENSNSLIKNDVLIFPNPTHEILNVKLNIEDEIWIYDNQGRFIIHSPRSFNHEIETLNLDKGIYFLRNSSGKKTVFIKS